MRQATKYNVEKKRDFFFLNHENVFLTKIKSYIKISLSNSHIILSGEVIEYFLLNCNIPSKNVCVFNMKYLSWQTTKYQF